ncbi:MAG: hypothetical protein WAO58_05500 [Fimbriimonadaceae bacterium]
MVVRVPEDIAQMVEQLSHASGSAPDALVVSALRSHFAPIARPVLSDFAMWELASEFDAARCGSFRGDL